MKIQNKTEIDLSIDNLRDIIISHLKKEGVDGKAWDFDFRVVNKPYSCGMHDSYDRHEFDGVKIVVTR